MKILKISFDTDVDGMEFSTSPDLVRHFGQNFGNLAFVYASGLIFSGRHHLLATEKVAGVVKKENYDAMLFPAANNLGPHSDLGWLADLMEAVPLPILIIGLGVQAPLEGGEIVLPAGSVRFLEVLRRRGLPVGVRGPMTQHFLKIHGIENAVVTGCPSNFLNPNVALGTRLQKKFEALRTRNGAVALNLEYFRLKSEPTQKLVDWARVRGGVNIFQSDERVVSLLRGDLPSEESEFRKYVKRYFLGDASEERLDNWLAQHCRVFIHTPSWIDYLRTVSLSTGTRFHGNMLAIQAETPAVVLYHDQRTLEMAETMQVPCLPWKGFTDHDISEQLLSVRMDGSLFDENRRFLARKAVELAGEIGIPVGDRLRTLTG